MPRIKNLVTPQHVKENFSMSVNLKFTQIWGAKSLENGDTVQNKEILLNIQSDNGTVHTYAEEVEISIVEYAVNYGKNK